jgi:hypothetical protein
MTITVDPKMLEGRTLSVDGEECSGEDFAADNADGLSEEEFAGLAALEPGESETFGGGAAAEIVVTRLS